MADNEVISDVKTAVREVLNETAVTYAQGAGAFIDAMTTSVANAADAFDAFFTANLERDRPEVAAIVLDMRLRSLRQAAAVINKKIKDLESRIARVKRSTGAGKSRRARKA